MSPDWVNPLVHEGDVTVERQLPGGLSASVAYVVSRGLHLPIFYDANLAPSTTTKSYDILNSSSQTAQTVTVPVLHQPHRHQYRRGFYRPERRQLLVQLDGHHLPPAHAARPGIHRQLHA